MAEAESRAIFLVLIGGAYFFLVLPLLIFRLRRMLEGTAMAIFLGALLVWFMAHLLLAFGAPWTEGLLVLSAAAMGVAILDLARHYPRLISTPLEEEEAEPSERDGTMGKF